MYFTGKPNSSQTIEFESKMDENLSQKHHCSMIWDQGDKKQVKNEQIMIKKSLLHATSILCLANSGIL